MLEDQGRLHGGSWPGRERHGKQRNLTVQVTCSCSPTLTHAHTRQLAPRCACYALPRKDAVRGAHRTGWTREFERTFLHVGPRFASSWNSSAPPTGNQPPLGSLSTEVGGDGSAAHIHWWPLTIDPAPRPRRKPLWRPTSGKGRNRRAGGGGVKMAAPLRIQSDWAQALR